MTTKDLGMLDHIADCLLQDHMELMNENRVLKETVEACESEKDIAYRERNQLVALLSVLFPAGRAKTRIEGWDENWDGCVYIEFPWGQASWHYHRDDEEMFAHLPPYTKPWDGHTTEAKYAAIAAAIRARGEK